MLLTFSPHFRPEIENSPTPKKIKIFTNDCPIADIVSQNPVDKSFVPNEAQFDDAGDDLLVEQESESNEAYAVSNMEDEQMEFADLEQCEEYLEEEAEEDEETFEEDQRQEVEDDIEIKTETMELLPEDFKPFVCLYCEKTFLTRSGRDTHQQIKHKIPEEFNVPDLDPHEFELELPTGELVRAWRCPDCKLVSRRKSHHQTHLIRHAIRRKEEAMKRDIQNTCFVIMKNQTLGESSGDPKEVVQDIIPFEINDQPHRLKSTTITDATTIPKKSKAWFRSVAKCVVVKAMDNSTHFSCSACNSKFQEEPDALLHVQKFGTGLCVSAFCKDCKVVFPSEKSFKRHLGFHLLAPITSSLTYFECMDCRVTFSNQKDLAGHLELHATKKDYKYEPETTTRLDGCEIMLNKLEVEKDRFDFSCAYCMMSGLRPQINLHMTLFHANLICPYDKQEFSRSLGYFMDHMKTKHPELFEGVELTFECPHCHEEFPSKELMKVHCIKCDAKLFKCSHCPKIFALERQLKLHLAAVNGIRNHKCMFCDKSFTNHTEMKIHMRSHTKDKPYTCTFPNCHKTFRTNSHRSAHMDVHNTKKSFQCKVCLVMFQTRGARRIHEKTHASGANTCMLCHRDFRQRSHYVRHVNAVHHIRCNSYNLEEIIENYSKKIDLSESDNSNQ